MAERLTVSVADESMLTASATPRPWPAGSRPPRFEVEIGQGLTVGVRHDEAGVVRLSGCAAHGRACLTRDLN